MDSRNDTFDTGTLFAISYAALMERTNLKALADTQDGYLVIPNLSKIDLSLRELIYAMMNTNQRLEDACCLRAHILMLFMEISKSLALYEQSGIHYIKKIQLYIKHHLNQKISLDDIAAAVGYHKSYVAAQFKSFTGKTIMQTVNEMRVSKSLLMLRDTGTPVAEIARQVGFPSYAQMVHEFNKLVGMPPQRLPQGLSERRTRLRQPPVQFHRHPHQRRGLPPRRNVLYPRLLQKEPQIQIQGTAQLLIFARLRLVPLCRTRRPSRELIAPFSVPRRSDCTVLPVTSLCFGVIPVAQVRGLSFSRHSSFS